MFNRLLSNLGFNKSRGPAGDVVARMRAGYQAIETGKPTVAMPTIGSASSGRGRAFNRMMKEAETNGAAMFAVNPYGYSDVPDSFRAFGADTQMINRVGKGEMKALQQAKQGEKNIMMPQHGFLKTAGGGPGGIFDQKVQQMVGLFGGMQNAIFPRVELGEMLLPGGGIARGKTAIMNVVEREGLLAAQTLANAMAPGAALQKFQRKILKNVGRGPMTRPM